MKFLLGRKLEMSQIFDKEGNVIPVTLIEAGPCAVLQVKTKEKDGYEAIQLGFGTKKPKNIPKPQLGHFKSLGNFRWLREFRLAGGQSGKETKDIKEYKGGDKVDVNVFQEGDKVKISGISKGKGFQGVVKRHNFRGQPASRGTKHAHRQAGSIGATWPQRVIKGRRMAGRMGSDRVTVRNLEIVKVDQENNLLAVKGAVPGSRGSLVEIRG